jgi:hypothetical protein
MDCEAIHVGGPNDGGIDVVLILGDRRYVVQTKRRAGTAAESVASIREFVGAMVLADELRGIFVTTAQKFSTQATAAAALAVDRNVVEYIDLVDPGRLLAVCDLAAKKDTNLWEKVKSNVEDLPRHGRTGSNAFLELYMGHPDWRVNRSDL